MASAAEAQPSASPTILKCKEPYTALAFSPNSQFLVTGSQEGVIRSYLLPSTRVHRAVKSLGDEVSSIILETAHDTEVFPRFWVACGRRALLFNLNTEKLILKDEDANEAIVLIDEGVEDECLNQIALHEGMIAYSTDSGEVGVYSLASRAKTVMKAKHTSICSSVGFIPRWPGEIVSGGYDCQLLHFDCAQEDQMSSASIQGATSSGNMSLSPPFVLSLTFSESGCIAASTADGRIWIGTKGVLGHDGKKVRRQQKWRGLLQDDSGQNFWITVATGPVVAVEFLGGVPASKMLLLVATLSGKIQLLSIQSASSQRQSGPPFRVIWETSSKSITKVNGLVASVLASDGATRIVAAAGLGADGKGYTEIIALPETLF